MAKISCGALVALPLLSISLLSPHTARADEGEQNKSMATDLFDAGVRKMSQGKCDQSPIADAAVCREARDAFKRSYALYPAGLGALRNLAYVEENLGLIASAARNFRELTRKAPLDPKPARRLWAEFAQKEFEALAPRIPHLLLEVPADRPASMTLVLDGSPLPEAAWGTELDVDPGHHTVRAEAADHDPFEESFDLAEREKKRIALTLVFHPQPSAGPVAPLAPAPAADAPPPPPPRSRLAPLLVAGAGAVGVGVGLGFGYVAIKTKKDACGDGHFCDPDQLDSGKSAARVSDIVTGVGAAALAGGLAWYFLAAPHRADKKAAVIVPYGTTDGAGLGAFGTF